MLRNAVLLAVACVSLAVGATQDVAVQKEIDRLHVPATLVPKEKRPLFIARGEGVQVYAANEKEGKLQWVLQGPVAVLLDYRTGEKIGTHSAGPTWVGNDGGKLTGTKLASEDSPNADAVSWLLLQVKAENGGRFAKVTHIQRLDTWGGRPPAAAPLKPGDTKEVRYEATYVFLGDE